MAVTIDQLLPDKYGVCRGFVVSQDGAKGGDDIIIYDRLAAPLLRPVADTRFTRKEEVPIEAVYAYIEAKNTLELKNKKSKNYIGNAISQISSVKEVCKKRGKQEDIIDGIPINGAFSITRDQCLPQYSNPLYTLIFSRGVRINGTLVSDPLEIQNALQNVEKWDEGPDLFVLGKDNIQYPFGSVNVDKSELGDSSTLLFVMDPENDKFAALITEGFAYGYGLASLMLALQKIRLGPVPWMNVLNDGIANATRCKNNVKSEY